jgi:uncharacterized protein (TIRG00374 family)
MVEGYLENPISAERHSEKTRPRQRLKWIFSLLKITIGLGLIILLIISGRLNLGVIFIVYRHPAYFIAGILCCIGAFLFPIYRWWVLARIQKLPIGGFDALRFTMIGCFFNTFIPGSSGGDIIRAAYTIKSCSEKKPHVLTVAVADRALGLHALLIISAAAMLMQPALLSHVPGIQRWTGMITGLIIAGIVVPFWFLRKSADSVVIRLCGKIVGGAEAWHAALQLYRQQPGMVCLAYLCSVANVMLSIFLIHFMMRASGANPGVLESLVVAPLVILANSLPITPGGLGIAEAASASLYNLVGQAGGANGMMLARLIIILFSLIGLPFFLLNKSSSRNPVKP